MIPLTTWVDIAQVAGVVLAPLTIAVGVLLWRISLQSKKIDEVEAAFRRLLREHEIKTKKDLDDRLRTEFDGIRKSLDHLQVIESCWSDFVGCIVDNLMATSNRQDWHAAILSRIVDPDELGIDGKAAMQCEAKLRRELSPRLLELELFLTDSRARLSAARGLANGEGDTTTLLRISAVHRHDPAMHEHLQKLAWRLGESQG